MKKYIIFLFLLIMTIVLKVNTIDELILKINTNKFNEALKVYLTDHEITNEVEEIISLNTLKEEGLINDNLNINYEKNYYRVSKLSDSELECQNGMNFSAVTNWLNNKDKSNEIYFCEKETEGEEPVGDVFDPYKLCGKDSDKLFCKVITNAMEQEDEYKEEYLEKGKITTVSI